MSATPHSRSLLLVDEPPILFLPRLAAVIGENDAIMLQQLHYWLDVAGHEYDGRRWIYNSYNEWAAQLPFWSRETVRRTLGRLRASGRPWLIKPVDLDTLGPVLVRLATRS